MYISTSIRAVLQWRWKSWKKNIENKYLNHTVAKVFPRSEIFTSIQLNISLSRVKTCMEGKFSLHTGFDAWRVKYFSRWREKNRCAEIFCDCVAWKTATSETWGESCSLKETIYFSQVKFTKIYCGIQHCITKPGVTGQAIWHHQSVV